ncbi:hypothetical protein [Streptomyces sp. NPDC088400]|uniref:AMIN-like domain-containing (lipo)protein n=1 Tax=Streptomyces sp. NPDC088400 TaxID=3365861 RepID=UPI0038071227
MRRFGTTLAVLVLAGAGTAGAMGTAQADSATSASASTSAACETGWGSAEKLVRPSENYKPPLTNVKTSRHECFDRMVFDFRGGSAEGALGYRVKYVDKLTVPGSPDLPPLSGGATLQVAVGPNFDPSTGSDSYPAQHGRPLPGVDVTGYDTFKDTRYIDALEDDVLVGVGVRARLPFRVTQSGGQLIVDVAHSWNATS